MPLYFAYGSNMDAQAMAQRCPRSKALGRARLPRFAFALMKEGYATVAPSPRAVVHGVLWDMAFSDMPALDAYENVAGGLYRKIVQGVFREGAGAARAIVYVGKPAGNARALHGYLESVIAAARAWELPKAYVRELEAFDGGGGLAVRGSQTFREPRPQAALRAERDEQGNVIVRKRFGSPLDGSRT